jgi:hypothetical protein
MRASLAVVVLAIVLSAASGCGGGAASGQPPTVAAWKAKVSAVCRRTKRTVERTPRPRNIGQVPAFVAATAPAWKQELDEIRALPTPDDVADKAKEYTTAESYFAQALVEALVTAQRDDEGRTGSAFAKATGAVKDMRAAAGALGLTACSQRRMP